MGKLDTLQEQYILSGLRQDNKDAFSLLFKMYYLDLVLFCGNFIKQKEVCEDIVQSIFTKLWNDRKVLRIEISLKSYLLKSVRNSCLDEFRHQEIVRQYESDYKNSVLDDYDTENYVLYSDLSNHLNEALQKLPEACRIAFQMNRFQGMKYREIALQLNVSERTVEVRVSKALELLRDHLSEFFIILFLLCLKNVIALWYKIF